MNKEFIEKRMEELELTTLDLSKMTGIRHIRLKNLIEGTQVLKLNDIFPLKEALKLSSEEFDKYLCR